MKALFALFSFILFSVAVHSQQSAEIAWSDEFDFDRNSEFNTIIGTKHGKTYVLSTSASNPVNSISVKLDVYDSDSLTYLNGLEIIDNKSDESFEEVVMTKDKILVFTSYYDRQLGLQVLNMMEFNELENKLEVIKRIDEILSSEKDEQRLFRIAVSPDGNYILVYHENSSNNGYKVFNLKVLDQNYSPIWEKELSLNYKERMVNSEDLIIDNNSTVYLLSSINPYGLKRSTGLGSLVNIKNTLFTYRPDEDKLKEFEFALSRNWISKVKMKLNDDQNLVATAFYTYPNDYKVRGFVMFQIEGETGDIMNRKLIPFNKEQFSVFDGSIRRLKDYARNLVGNSGIYPGSSSHMNSTANEFILKDIHMMENSIVLSMESLRRDERCTESFSDQQMIVDCQKHFFYGDVILVFLTRYGEVKKISKVEKMQHAENKENEYFSYSSIANNNDLYIIYNDDYRNMEQNEFPQKIALGKMNKSRINMQSFNKDGKARNILLPDQYDDDVRFFPREYQLLNGKDVLLYSQKEKNYKFGLLSFQ